MSDPNSPGFELTGLVLRCGDGSDFVTLHLSASSAQADIDETVAEWTDDADGVADYDLHGTGTWASEGFALVAGSLALPCDLGDRGGRELASQHLRAAAKALSTGHPDAVAFLEHLAAEIAP
jgi:hypothetical protein